MKLIAAAILLFAVSPASASDTPKVGAAKAESDGELTEEWVDGPLGKELDEAIRSYGDGAFSGSILIQHQGRLILAKGYHLAEEDKKSPTPEPTTDGDGG